MPGGKLNISSHLNEHTYPGILMKFPWLIHFIYGWNYLILQRNSVVKKALKKELGQLPKGRLLDAGCGEGMFILPHAGNYPNLHFTGIDKNNDHLDFCKNYCRVNNLPNTSFFYHHLEDAFPEPTVDLLLCIGTLQYIEDDETAIANFYHMLKKGGKAIIYVPINGHMILPLYRHYFSNKKHYEKSQNRKRVYQEKEILGKLKKAGFKIIDKNHTYGKLGIIGHELYSLLLIGIGSGKWYTLLFGIALIIALPFILIMVWMDSFFKKQNGNGLLILAKKNIT